MTQNQRQPIGGKVSVSGESCHLLGLYLPQIGPVSGQVKPLHTSINRHSSCSWLSFSRREIHPL